MLAKKAAERAKKEFEERLAQEAENRRLSAIPQWKRDLLARKEEAENKLKATVYTPRIDEHSRITNTWRLRNVQRAMSIDNISFISTSDHDLSSPTSTAIKSNREHLTNGNHHHNQSVNSSMENLSKHENSNNNNENIIPWRAQLRKTNSRLSLVG
jgi:hypothetical protein